MTEQTNTQSSTGERQPLFDTAVQSVAQVRLPSVLFTNDGPMLSHAALALLAVVHELVPLIGHHATMERLASVPIKQTTLAKRLKIFALVCGEQNANLPITAS